MKNLKYIALSFLAIGILACENDTLDDLRNRGNTDAEPLPELTSGTADFSNYVAIGPSFTAGVSDGTLFLATQENSFPKILADQFANIGGGTFTQPLVNDNFGGLALNGTRIADPRLVFGGAGPVGLESVIGPVTVGTDIVLNNPAGPFNNLGIPGAKSFDFLEPGYGNIANFPAAANPYAVRVTGNAPNATILELATAQNPTFFTADLIGGNDILGYATSGGDQSVDQITDLVTFENSFNAIVAGLTTNGSKGVVTTVPCVKSLPFFTTVPHNPLDPSNPAFGPLIPTLNSLYGALNDVYAFLEFQGAIDDAATRTVVFSDSQANAVVIVDENLDNISTLITQTLLGNPQFPAFIAQFGLPAAAAPQVAGLLGLVYGQARQATPDDLFVLTSASVIGTVNSEFSLFLQSQGIPAATADQFAAEGVTLPLEDKWSLVPEEQMEIADAVIAYNEIVSNVASTNNIGLVDLNAILEEAATTGIVFDDYIHTTDLVFGGLVSLDGIHLTSRGYALMANAFLQAIDTTYGSNFEASGNLAKADDYVTNYSPLLQ